jgi:hypothetical protein
MKEKAKQMKQHYYCHVKTYKEIFNVIGSMFTMCRILQGISFFKMPHEFFSHDTHRYLLGIMNNNNNNDNK